MSSYTGIKAPRESKNGGKDWLFYTAGMGILPILIKGIIAIVYRKPFNFDDYSVEMFFITVIFLVDAIRNFGVVSSWMGKGTTLILALSAAIYGAILVAKTVPAGTALGMSSDTLAIIVSVFLAASLILDVISMRVT